MYPSIPKELGLAECRAQLETRTDGLSTDCVMEGLEIALDNNLTEFDGTLYRQEKGAGIGPNYSSPYCNISMNKIDKMVMGAEAPYNPNCWDRYQDDTFEPWTHGENALLEFTTWLNSISPDIKFTIKYSKEGIEFLDIYVYIKNGKFQTKVYSKPSDTYCYLTPNSCHPFHQVKNIPQNTAYRIRKICSEQQEYEEQKRQYTEHLVARGYKREFVVKSFEIVEEKDREELYRERTDEVDASNKPQINPLVIDYNPMLPNASKTLNKYKYLLELDENLVKIIPPESVICSYRRAKTLNDILTSSKFKSSTNDNHNGGCFKCNKVRCHVCEFYLVEGNTFSSYQCPQTFNISKKLSCNTQGVIYLIQDIICKRSSVGSTINDFASRWSNHKSHIKNNFRKCEVAVHMNDTPDHTWDSSSISMYNESLSQVLKVKIIDKVDFESKDSKITKMRKVKEREGYWQTQLRTMVRYGGLNVLDELAIHNKQVARSDSAFRL